MWNEHVTVYLSAQYDSDCYAAYFGSYQASQQSGDDDVGRYFPRGRPWRPSRWGRAELAEKKRADTKFRVNNFIDS